MATKNQILEIIGQLEEDKKEAENTLKEMGTSMDEIMKQDNDPQYEAGIINQSDYAIKLLEALL